MRTPALKRTIDSHALSKTTFSTQKLTCVKYRLSGQKTTQGLLQRQHPNNSMDDAETTL